MKNKAEKLAQIDAAGKWAKKWAHELAQMSLNDDDDGCFITFMTALKIMLESVEAMGEGELHEALKGAFVATFDTEAAAGILGQIICDSEEDARLILKAANTRATGETLNKWMEE